MSSTVEQSQNVSLQADISPPADDMLVLRNENVLLYTNDNHTVSITDENMLCKDDNSPILDDNTQNINAENINFEIRNENWLDDNMPLNIVSVNVAGLQSKLSQGIIDQMLYNYDIICLSETNTDKSIFTNTLLNEYSCFSKEKNQSLK